MQRKRGAIDSIEDGIVPGNGSEIGGVEVGGKCETLKATECDAMAVGSSIDSEIFLW